MHFPINLQLHVKGCTLLSLTTDRSWLLMCCGLCRPVLHDQHVSALSCLLWPDVQISLSYMCSYAGLGVCSFMHLLLSVSSAFRDACLCASDCRWLFCSVVDISNEHVVILWCCKLLRPGQGLLEELKVWQQGCLLTRFRLCHWAGHQWCSACSWKQPCGHSHGARLGSSAQGCFARTKTRSQAHSISPRGALHPSAGGEALVLLQQLIDGRASVPGTSLASHSPPTSFFFKGKFSSWSFDLQNEV